MLGAVTSFNVGTVTTLYCRNPQPTLDLMRDGFAPVTAMVCCVMQWYANTDNDSIAGDGIEVQEGYGQSCLARLRVCFCTTRLTHNCRLA